MSISQPPFQSTLVDANDRVQTPWAQWFSQLQPILQSVVASGPTSGRPTQNLYIGYPYFDTTIDQMVYWNGVIWVTYAPSTTGTSILKGNGLGGFNNAVAGIDFAPATSGNAILYGNGSGGFSSVAIGSGVTFAGGVLSATGSGGTVTAVTGTAPIASSGGTAPAISISQAGASTNGYLSSIDWNIFNSKAPATSGASILYGDGTGGFSNVTIGSGVTFVAGTLSATGSGGTVTAVTGTAPIASSGGTAPAISISQAGTATDGYLSSIDWNTFNNKGSGTVTAVTGSGNIASSGGTTPNITFTGTLPIANGGTNGTATPTAGAVAVGNGTQYAFTAAGSAGQVLTSNGSTVPTWATVATGIGTTGYWGSFWDTTNQTAASTTVAYTINIGTSDPNNNGVSIVSSNRITVAYAGVYNIQYSIQFENIGTGNKNYNVDVWFRLNGVDIPDTNSTYWIASKNSTVNGELIAAVNYVLSLAAGDYIQLMWAVSDVDISIATISATSSPTVPRTPGVIVTVTPITEVGIGYYNLTSVSSVAIATGSKTFTTNLSNISTAFTVGTRVRVAYVTTPANYMEGVITSFSGTTLVVNVDSIGGSGTYANWTISVAGIQGSNGVTSFSGNSTGLTPATATTGAISLAGTLVATNGGTGKSTTAIGDLLQGGATDTWATLSSVATGNALISGGVTSASSWGKIGLTTHISGTLAVGNGGTGLTAVTAGHIPFGNSASALNTDANLFWDNTNKFLGVGTSTPLANLSVTYTGTGNGYLKATQGLLIDNIENSATNEGPGLSFGHFSATTPQIVGRIATIRGAYPVMRMAFMFRAGGSGTGDFAAADERITILSNGKVGIANSFPQVPLQVNGAVSIQGSASFPTSGSGWEIYSSSATVNAINSYNRTSSLWMSAAYNSLEHIFSTSGSEKARIFSSGGLSLGNTTDPGATNLSVTGTIASAKTVNTGGYTVATLPTGVTGARAYVTNALAPTFGSTVVAGGAITIPVFYNGTNWIVG